MQKYNFHHYQLKLIFLLFFSFPTQALEVSDESVKALIIQRSIAEYRGNCPCPYNYAKNGSICGGRSAYSRRGGASPYCYPSDVPNQMVDEIRKSLK